MHSPIPKTAFGLLRRVARNLPPRRRLQFALIALLSLVAALGELASIGSVVPFLALLINPDSVLRNSTARYVVHLLGLKGAESLTFLITVTFCLAAVFAGAVRLLLYWVQARFSNAVGVDISDGIFRRTVYQPYAVHIARNSSEIISATIGKANQVVYGAIMPASLAIGSAVILVIVAIALAGFEPLVALAAIGGFGAIYGLIIVMTRTRLRNYSRLISREQTQMTRVVQETLVGIREVILDGTQELYCAEFRTTSRNFRRASAGVQFLGASPRYLMESLGMVLIAGLAYVLAGRGGGLRGAVPVLGAFALGAQRMLPSLQQLFMGITTIRSSIDSVNDALDLLEQPLPPVAVEGAAEVLPFKYEIRLKEVMFRYAEQGPWVLQGIDLCIPRGSSVGIIGATGGGKSTLLDIIMGLLAVNGGEVCVDGVKITDRNLRAWQRQLAHVPQAIFLADTTVAENIGFGIPASQIDLERVKMAARLARLDSTIEQWPEFLPAFPAPPWSSESAPCLSTYCSYAGGSLSSL